MDEAGTGLPLAEEALAEAELSSNLQLHAEGEPRSDVIPWFNWGSSSGSSSSRSSSGSSSSCCSYGAKAQLQ